jgi:hypothetical protein
VERYRKPLMLGCAVDPNRRQAPAFRAGKNSVDAEGALSATLNEAYAARREPIQMADESLFAIRSAPLALS